MPEFATVGATTLMLNKQAVFDSFFQQWELVGFIRDL